MSGQIVDASLISAPKQRSTQEEKQAIKEGRIPQEWAKKPAKLAHKDRDARWTVKFTKAKERTDGTKPPVDIAIPAFGYKNHVAIDKEFGLIRTWLATDAAAYDGARLREGLLDKTNTASAVWADTGHRSQANEDFMAKNGFVSKVHRKKPKGRPMPDVTRRANALKSKVRSHVEHVFAVQKDRMDLFIRTVGIARATTKIGMANIVYSPVGTARSAQADAVPAKDRARMRANGGAQPHKRPLHGKRRAKSPQSRRPSHARRNQTVAAHFKNRVDRTVQLAKAMRTRFVIAYGGKREAQ